MYVLEKIFVQFSTGTILQNPVYLKILASIILTNNYSIQLTTLF